MVESNPDLARLTRTTQLSREIAVVTGGAGGLGAAVAVALAGAGARVAVADLDHEAAGAVAAGLGPGHIALPIDVRSSASVRAVADGVSAQLGPPSILFCGAGVQRVRPTLEVTDEDWDFVVDINLGGTFRCCQAFGAAMVEQGRGAIVNVASLTGVEFGGGGRVPYGASKGGVMGLTRALAIEWAPYGVRVNAVAPGIVATPMVQGLAADGSLDLDDLAGRVPLGRIATPEDIAGVTLMLVSDPGAYIVGQTLIVDGGLSSCGPRDTSRD
ncbi:MAG TPA: SDR family NAD(P)-dependent oxidoreductase [Solirubrobacteraceae bacterium]|nr:SDR family NAD(P)-dependent oxidoreductase [Solirubrobacteraceae bacterium]